MPAHQASICWNPDRLHSRNVWVVDCKSLYPSIISAPSTSLRCRTGASGAGYGSHPDRGLRVPPHAGEPARACSMTLSRRDPQESGDTGASMRQDSDELLNTGVLGRRPLPAFSTRLAQRHPPARARELFLWSKAVRGPPGFMGANTGTRQSCSSIRATAIRPRARARVLLSISPTLGLLPSLLLPLTPLAWGWPAPFSPSLVLFSPRACRSASRRFAVPSPFLRSRAPSFGGALGGVAASGAPEFENCDRNCFCRAPGKHAAGASQALCRFARRGMPIECRVHRMEVVPATGRRLQTRCSASSHTPVHRPKSVYELSSRTS